MTYEKTLITEALFNTVQWVEVIDIDRVGQTAIVMDDDGGEFCVSLEQLDLINTKEI